MNHTDNSIIWKDIPGYEGRYQVSNIGGFVKSLPNVKRHSVIIRSSYNHKYGYPQFTLSKDGENKLYTIHTLVLTAFVSERPEGMQCLHIDGNPLNNNLDNLRWGTPTENAYDKRRHGTLMIGEKNHKTKLSEKDVKSIRRLINKKTVPLTEIAKKFKVVPGAIHNIKTGLTWKWLAI